MYNIDNLPLSYLAYLFPSHEGAFKLFNAEIKKYTGHIERLEADIKRLEAEGITIETLEKKKKEKEGFEMELKDILRRKLNVSMEKVTDSLSKEDTYYRNQFLFLKKKVRDFPLIHVNVKTFSHDLERSMERIMTSNRVDIPFNILSENYILREKVTLERMRGGKRPTYKNILSFFNTKNYEASFFFKRTRLYDEFNDEYYYEAKEIDEEVEDKLIDLLPVEFGNNACRWKASSKSTRFKKDDIEHRAIKSRKIYDRLMDIDGKSEEFSVTDKKKLMRAEFCVLERMMEGAVLKELMEKSESLESYLKEYNEHGLSGMTLLLDETLNPDLVTIEHPSIHALARESRYYDILKEAFNERVEKRWEMDMDKVVKRNDGAELEYIRLGTDYINSLKKKDIP